MLLSIFIIYIIAIFANIIAKQFKKIYISEPIIYLIIGLLFSYFYKHIQSPIIFETFDYSWSLYKSIGIYLLFYSSGFKIVLKKFMSSDSSVLKLSIYPVYAEIIVMFIVLELLNLIVLNSNVQAYEILFVTSLFAMSSPANVIPISLEHIKFNRNRYNDVCNVMITTSILDNVTSFPIIIAILPIIQFGDFSKDVLFSSFITLVILAFFAFLIGVINYFLSSFSFLVNSKKNIAPVMFLVFSTFILIINSFNIFSEQLSNFSFIIAIIASSTTANLLQGSSKSMIIGNTLSTYFSKYFMPIIFIGVGVSVNLSVLSNLSIILFFVILIIFSLFIKLQVASKILIKDNFHSNAIKYVHSAFVPKGITLINFSIIIGNFPNPNSELINFMTTFGAISIILTLPVGLILMTNFGSKWLE